MTDVSEIIGTPTFGDKLSWFFRFALERNRELFIGMEAVMFAIGAAFWIEAIYSGQAFSRETWGDFCLQFPAEVWAGLMMVQSAITFGGLSRPVKWRHVAVGSSIAAGHFAIVAYSAIFTGGEFVIGIYAAAFFVPLHLVMAISAVYRGGP